MARADQARRRKEEILEAALQVFGAKGFQAATNRDIAEAAGIASPGLIYHYFKDKQDLLTQLLERVNPALQLANTPEQMLQLPLREALVQFAAGFLRLGEDPDRVAVMRLVFGEALREPATAQALFAAGPQRGLGLLAQLFAQAVQRGQVRPQPPEVLARQFVGPLLAAVMFRVVFRQEGPDPARAAGAPLVDLFLEGALSR